MGDLTLDGEETEEKEVEEESPPKLRVERGNVEVITVALLNDISSKLDILIDLLRDK